MCVNIERVLYIEIVLYIERVSYIERVLYIYRIAELKVKELVMLIIVKTLLLLTC